MDDETLETSVAEAVLRDGARSVRSDTLLLVDPTEIRKEFSYKMEFVTRVRDASRSSKEGRDVLVNGYHGCMVAVCRPGGRKTVPLALKLWSSRSPGFKGENDEVLKIVKAVYAATGGKGSVVYDRGGRAAYAIADGIKRAFTRFGKWVRTAADTIAKAHDAPAIQLLPGFAELLDIDDG